MMFQLKSFQNKATKNDKYVKKFILLWFYLFMKFKLNF